MEAKGLRLDRNSSCAPLSDELSAAQGTRSAFFSLIFSLSSSNRNVSEKTHFQNPFGSHPIQRSDVNGVSHPWLVSADHLWYDLYARMVLHYDRMSLLCDRMGISSDQMSPVGLVGTPLSSGLSDSTATTASIRIRASLSAGNRGLWLVSLTGVVDPTLGLEDRHLRSFFFFVYHHLGDLDWSRTYERR